MSHPIAGIRSVDLLDHSPAIDQNSGLYNVSSWEVHEPLRAIKSQLAHLMREGGFDHPLLTSSLRKEVERLWPQMSFLGSQVHEDLATKGGLALIEGWPSLGSFEDRGLLFLSLAVYVGIPIPHDAQDRQILWNIAPQDYQGDYPTFSHNRTKAPLHTDGVYKHQPPDSMGLYMVSQALEGGASTWLDGFELVERIKKSERGRKTLQVLKRPFPIRVPSAYLSDSGIPEQIRAPVLSLDEKRLRFREDTLRAGAAGQTMDLEEEEALNDFSEELEQSQPRNHRMENGSMLFLNNQRILHGRTAFSGSRLAYRVWLKI